MGNGLSSTEARALQSQTRLSVKEVKKMWKRWHKVSGVHGNEGISDPIMIADVATQLGLAEKVMRLRNTLRGVPEEQGLDNLSVLLESEEVKISLAQTLLRLFDYNKDGKINFEEVVLGASVMSSESREELAHLQFQIVDVDSSGTITRDEAHDLISSITTGIKVYTLYEISKRLRKRGLDDAKVAAVGNAVEELWNRRVQEHSEAFAEALFETADSNSDGVVSLDEYIAWSTDSAARHSFMEKMTVLMEPIEQQFKVSLKEAIMEAIALTARPQE